jgi:hypothetical protein
MSRLTQLERRPRRTNHLLSALIPLALISPEGMYAQESPAYQTHPPISEGSRVRITSAAEGLKGAKGEVLRIDEERILVQLDRGKGRIGVPQENVDAMDVSVAQHRNAGKGLAIGALSGVVFGAVMGLSATNDGWFTPEETAMVLGTGFGLIGGVVGLFAGALTVSDEWAPASVESGSPSLSPIITASGAGIGVSLRF